MNDDEEAGLLINSTRGSLRKGAYRSSWRCVGRCCPWLPARYVLTIMGFLGFCNVYALRVNLSIAIVQMVNDSSAASGSPQPHAHEVFLWTPAEKGWILSAFFFGYMLTQLPGGWLATRFGGKHVYGLGVVMASVLTLLTPIAAETSVWMLVGVRVLEGMFEGVTYPAMFTLLGRWAPMSERSFMSTTVQSGAYVGSVVSYPLSAVLCMYGFNGGWPSVFYVFGGVGILWYIVWLLTVYNSPGSHPWISVQEQDYIQDNIVKDRFHDENVPVPWCQMFTSPPLLAVCVAGFSSTYGFYSMLTCMPLYLQEVLNISQDNDIIENGIYSAIPFLVNAVLALLSGVIADALIRKCFSTTVVRKLCTCSALTISGVSIFLCGYLGTSQLTAIALLSIGVGMNGLNLAGVMTNLIDIAPRFSGILMGVSNTIATVPGVIGPVIIGAIVHDTNASIGVFREEWREVFTIAAEVYLFGAFIYLILADGNKQWWADGVIKNRNKLAIKLNHSGQYGSCNDDSST